MDLRIAGEAASWIFEVVCAGYRDLVLFRLHTRLMQKAAAMPAPTLFESPVFYDKLQNARRSLEWAQRLMNQAVMGVGVFAVFLALLGTLVLLHPLAAAAVCLTAVPSYVAQLPSGHGLWRVYRAQAPNERRLGHYFQLLTTDGAAKEIRLFGLGPYFLRRYQDTFEQALSEIEAFRRRQIPAMVGLPAISSLGAGAVLLYAVWQAAQGHLTVGDVVLYSGATPMVQGAVRNRLQFTGNLHTAQLHMSNITEFLDLDPPMRPPAGGRPVPAVWRKGVELRGVTFRYPGADRPVLKGVSLQIRPGETGAIVGPNGAG